MKVTLIDHNTRNIESMIQAIGVCRDKQCTEKTLNDCLEAKPVPHMSALEFGWAMVKVEGVSIKAARQLFRHRHFSYMEASSRSINLSDADWIVPNTAKSPTAMRRKMGEEVNVYDAFTLASESLEDAAYLLPLGIETKFFVAGNIRVWFEYFQKRLCKTHVQDEHYHLAVEVWNLLQPLFPILKKAYPCWKCGECSV